MSYSISSKEFQDPLLKPILEELSDHFKHQKIKFYLIGATARDIIMILHNEKSSRATHDLDIAIAISDWSQFAVVENGILQLENFTKDSTQKQRFIYKGIFILDIVPYGDIMDQDDKIFWPPDETIAMSVLGFSEVQQSVLKITIDNSFEIEIASLEGIFLLKLIAWNDRHKKGNKDADDMGFIINNYLSIYMDEALELHYEIFEDESFDTRTAGAKLLGKHISVLLSNHENTLNQLIDILEGQIALKEEGILVNQILETHKGFDFETILLCLELLTIEFKLQFKHE